MKKIVLSLSMLGESINDALETNVKLLCEELNVKFGEVMPALIATNNVKELNETLEKFFGDEIKIVD